MLGGERFVVPSHTQNLFDDRRFDVGQRVFPNSQFHANHRLMAGPLRARDRCWCVIFAQLRGGSQLAANVLPWQTIKARSMIFLSSLMFPG